MADYLELKTRKEFFAALRLGPYTALGSYPTYFATKNGETYSFRAAKENAADLGRRFRENDDPPAYFGVNYESDLICDLSDEPIERAYPAEADESTDSDV